MPINIGFVLNIIDDVKEYLSNQDYITCMNTLRDANRVIQKHEAKLPILLDAYYELRDENEFYMLFLEFISTQNMTFPRSFNHDRANLSLAHDYLHGLDDDADERIDDDIMLYLTNLNQIKTQYETFMIREHPELIDAAAIYIIKRSGYDNFDFCGRHFDSHMFDSNVWEE